MAIHILFGFAHGSTITGDLADRRVEPSKQDVLLAIKIIDLLEEKNAPYDQVWVDQPISMVMYTQDEQPDFVLDWQGKLPVIPRRVGEFVKEFERRGKKRGDLNATVISHAENAEEIQNMLWHSGVRIEKMHVMDNEGKFLVVSVGDPAANTPIKPAPATAAAEGENDMALRTVAPPSGVTTPKTSNKALRTAAGMASAALFLGAVVLLAFTLGTPSCGSAEATVIAEQVYEIGGRITTEENMLVLPLRNGGVISTPVQATVLDAKMPPCSLVVREVVEPPVDLEGFRLLAKDGQTETRWSTGRTSHVLAYNPNCQQR